MPQSLAKVYIHVVFSTKDRRPAVGDEWRDALFGVLGAAANNIGCQSLLMGGVADHVHMLFQLSRTLSLSDAVGRIKSHSSWWVNQNHTSTAMFHWQNGYAAFSVSQSSIAAVRE
jgi:putative transposase